MDIIISIAVLGITALLLGAILAYASKVFEVKNDPKMEEILSILPGVNCGACGYPGCAGYAEAVALHGAATNLCAPGGTEVSESIAQTLGVDSLESGEKRIARVMCGGDNSKTGRKYKFDAELKRCSTAVLYFFGDKQCDYGCMGYGDCERVCPFGAIFVNEKGIAVVDEQKCTACGKCVITCPKKIIKIIPESSRVSVICSSKDKGVLSKKICSVSCIACGMCVKSCPSAAITVDKNLAVIDSLKCTNCGVCGTKCPTNAIKSDIKEVKKAVIREEKCIGCTICAKQCPINAIDGEIKKKHKVNEEKCIGCEVCVNKCPVKAIEMKILIEKE